MKDGFSGFLSIEPHLQAVVHENKGITSSEAAYQAYVEYGRRLMKLVQKIESGKVVLSAAV